MPNVELIPVHNHISTIVTTLDGVHHSLNNHIAADFSKSFTPYLICKVLSQINRWSGNTVIPVNVAWHSIAVFRNMLHKNAMQLPQMTVQGIIWLFLKCLFHDAAEIISGDIARPVKQLLKEKSPGNACELYNLDNTLDEGCRIGILEKLKSKGKVIESFDRGQFLRFVERLEKSSDLWSNLNTIKPLIKRSDLDVAEIEHWLWMVNHHSKFNLTSPSTGFGSDLSSDTIIAQAVKHEAIIKDTSISERYWFPTPEYIAQGNLFSTRSTEIDLISDSAHTMLGIYNQIEGLISMFADPMNNIETFKQMNFMSYFFENYEERMNGFASKL